MKINLSRVEENIYKNLELAGTWETTARHEKWFAGTGVESFLHETGNV